MALGIDDALLWGAILFGAPQIIERLPLGEWFLPAGEKAQLSLERAKLGLQQKQFEAMRMMTKESRARADKMLEQMLKSRTTERSEARRMNLLNLLTQSKVARDAMMTSLVNSLMQQRRQVFLPSSAGPSTSLVGMLRR